MKHFISMVVVALLVAMAVPAMAQDSAALYKSKCQICHGPDGKGSAVGKKMGTKPFDSPDVAKQTDSQLIATTKNGKGKMPKYEGKLTDAQIKGLIAYIRTLK